MKSVFEKNSAKALEEAEQRKKLQVKTKPTNQLKKSVVQMDQSQPGLVIGKKRNSL